MEPQADEVICDPACGTSGFLVAAGEYLKEHRNARKSSSTAPNKDHYMNDMFHGYDMDRTMLRIGAMNMMTHGIDNPFIEYRDSLSDQNPDQEKYTADSGQSAVQGHAGRTTSCPRDLLKALQDEKDGAAVPGAVPADAEGGRPLRLHRARRRAVRLLQGPQGYPQGAGGEPPAGGGDLHALRRVQALCRACPRRCWCSPKPATAARTRCGSTT